MENRNLATWAAIAVGGLLVADQLRRRRPPTLMDQVDQSLDQELTVRIPTGTAALSLLAMAAGGWCVSSLLRSGPGDARMSNVQESIELDVPVSTAYNQWTQFEQFPRFMPTVREVRQLDDTHLHWKAMVAGKVKEWDAEITEQVPDKRIAWRSTSGARNAGVVTFHKVGDSRTRVLLQMDYEPTTLAERAGDMVGGVKLTAKGNLARFKKMVEQRGAETGAWRGEVPVH